MVDKPAAPETIKAIQALAADNQAIYEKTFAFVPRSLQSGSSKKIPASIWPVVNRDDDVPSEPIEAYASRMPFSEKFWEAKLALTKPEGIQGFFTALPRDWTRGENNHPDMNKLLLTQVIEPTESQTVALSDVARKDEVQS
jgi:phospholipase D1/2